VSRVEHNLLDRERYDCEIDRDWRWERLLWTLDLLRCGGQHFRRRRRLLDPWREGCDSEVWHERALVSRRLLDPWLEGCDMEVWHAGGLVSRSEYLRTLCDHQRRPGGFDMLFDDCRNNC
jgi:hypothetical protein